MSFAVPFAFECEAEQAVQDLVHLHLERVGLGVFPDFLGVAVARFGDVQAQFTGRGVVEARHPDIAAALLVGLLLLGRNMIGLTLAFVDAQLQRFAIDDQAANDRCGPCRRCPCVAPGFGFRSWW